MDNLEITIKKDTDGEYVVDANNQDIQLLEIARVLTRCSGKICDNHRELMRIPKLKLKKELSLKQYKKVLEAFASFEI
tara:strand:- start:2393 stop:2626 length:234 start_codon:yes stop_codon:yes gene_type:complete